MSLHCPDRQSLPELTKFTAQKKPDKAFPEILTSLLRHHVCSLANKVLQGDGKTDVL